MQDVPVRKERSLLEEQLLGPKPAKPLKREETVGVLAQSISLTSPPAATTRVPGVNGPLTYGVAKSTPTTQRANGTSSRLISCLSSFQNGLSFLES